MQKINFRIISREELNQVNTKITNNFGARSEITSGTCMISDDGKKQYHIVMENIAPHHPIAMIKEIGQYVKNVWGADEVYHFCVKVA